MRRRVVGLWHRPTEQAIRLPSEDGSAWPWPDLCFIRLVQSHEPDGHYRKASRETGSSSSWMCSVSLGGDPENLGMDRSSQVEAASRDCSEIACGTALNM